MNVPKLRFKEFNDEWKTHKLSDIGEFLKGGKLNKSDLSLNGIPCILYGELYTFYNEFATRIKSKTFTTSNLVLSKKYDILLPLSGETAEDISTCTCVFFDNIALGGDLLIFRNSLANSLFISLLLKYKYKYKIAQIAQGKSVVHINIKNLKNIKVNLPPLEEQNKLSNFLFVINKKIENLENTITSLENQKKGLLQQIFSQKLRFKDKNGNNYPNWKKKKLGDLFTIKAGGDINKENFSEQYSIEFKYPVYANALTNNGLYGYSNIYKIDKPSITVTGRGINVGFALSREPFYYPIVRLLVLIPNININFTFFTESINFIHIFNESTGVPQLTAPQLSKVNVYVPNIEEQNKIGNLFDKLNEKIDNKKAQLEHWQQIKKGLLQQMFV